MDGHWYIICERGIVEGGEYKEECDLDKVGEERDSSFSQLGKPGRPSERELAWECVEGYDEELEEGDEDA